MEKREKTIFKASLVIISCVLVAGIIGSAMSVLQVQTTVSSSGAVKGVGVGIYWDSLCANRTTQLVWGTIEPGTNKTVAVYARNEGNVASTLAKTVKNWNPSTAADYLKLNWNYTNQIIGPKKTIPINLTLVVPSNITAITSFSFDLIITASG